MTPTPQDWIKEFENRWIPSQAISTVIPAQGILCGDANEIKHFISLEKQNSTLQAYQEILKEIEDYDSDNQFNQYGLDGMNAVDACLSQIKSSIEDKAAKLK